MNKRGMAVVFFILLWFVGASAAFITASHLHAKQKAAQAQSK